MSISRKVYSGYLSLKGILTSKTFKYSFIGIFATLLFFGVFNAYAVDDTTQMSPDWGGTKEFHNVISGAEKDEDNMNSRQGLEVLNSAWTALSIVAPELSENYEDIKSSENVPNDLKRGLIGLTDDAGTLVYANYPAVNITEHLAQEWVPGHKESISSTYAANSSIGHPSGYQELLSSGIVGLWNKVLNISYVFFIVIMIVSGFMIMFRHKIGGQMMVTLGNVLPGIVLSLILATFSFAIAGFIIDIGGIVTGLVAYILGEGYELNSISNIGGLMGSVFTAGMTATTVGATVVGGLGIATYLGGAAATAALAAVFAPFAGIVGVIGIVVALVLVGIVFVGAVKVLITLYKAFFSLLLNVILGPIQITLGAFPGNRHMVTNWFLSILRNVLVFPVVLFIVNIPNAIYALDAEARLNFPGKLVYEDPATYSPAGGLDAAGGIFLFILRIFVLYFAAQAPKFLEAWFPPNSPKAVQEGVEQAKASLSRVPLIGGLFK